MNKEIKSLYRVHRPRQFNEVVGQDHVTKTLINQISKGNIGHAYLFCGTRGTGKTSVAKIFANAVNCLNFKDGKICGTCEYCQRAAGGNIDVFELDAASNNRVEDVRELIEKIKYPPVFAKYKVYIVDEVHMFSSSAFNAFLKTLEEPPSHVIFILATTEAHKLLPTVLSRCLRFDFRSVATAEIAELLKVVFEKEKITAEPEAVNLIAQAGCGSVRDALSVADMVSSYSISGTGDTSGGGKITIADVNEILGAVDKKVLDSLFQAIIKQDIKTIMEISESIFAIGRNVNSVIKDFLEIVKNFYVENYQDKQKTANVMNIYRNFSELEINIKTAADAKNIFQGTCLLAACRE